jgi:hypothetical protein
VLFCESLKLDPATIPGPRRRMHFPYRWRPTHTCIPVGTKVSNMSPIAIFSALPWSTGTWSQKTRMNNSFLMLDATRHHYCQHEVTPKNQISPFLHPPRILHSHYTQTRPGWLFFVDLASCLGAICTSWLDWSRNRTCVGTSCSSKGISVSRRHVDTTHTNALY